MTKRRRHTPANAIFGREAQCRFRLALDSIQEAYELVEQASQALSTVEGMILQRKALAALSNLLTQTWYALTATANRLSRTAVEPIAAEHQAPP